MGEQSTKEQKNKITFIKKLLSAAKNELYILSTKNAKIKNKKKNTKRTVLYTKRDTKFLNKIAQPIMKQFFVSHLHPAARQFCRSTYTITDNTIK
jgi:hypothetical protein